MDQELFKWIIGGLCTALTSMVGWWLKDRGAAADRERGLEEKLSSALIAKAICETKLEAYGMTAPELTERMDDLVDRLDSLLPPEAQTPPRRQETWPLVAQKRPNQRPRRSVR
jgi:hypothetical protein